ncbi:MAG: GTPase [Candidatus Yanofskybacteria bacterium]|nr:GTPase [Candidatus Yanofskybacteria bacterium]
MKLIFVYNSDGTIPSLIKDAAHKVISPGTYSCNLCRITYSGMAMQKTWRTFTQSLPYEVIFLHRDEFRKEYPSQKDIRLPALFVEGTLGLSLLIPHMEINKAKNVDGLIEIVKHFLPKRELYQCEECGLKYENKEIAEQCQAWRDEHKSCNLDLIKHAVKV